MELRRDETPIASRGVAASKPPAITPIDKRLGFHYMSGMINLFATYWYFSSSLAAGGLRSI
ncbi:MAG: hypothetical protein J0I79_26705 [Mesorhizobium sp.]|uniref:hypothetical protein n=1 Tax=Mesorhizobium sp. TaxID=1871066 RepID=UPI001ACEFF73|nr:hypothetical protein [Mesorhizobium sp.]MBN9221550.1 hypothetical protein [Mesorhizobium sp.]